jgi:hypothetical protein
MERVLNNYIKNELNRKKKNIEVDNIEGVFKNIVDN